MPSLSRETRSGFRGAVQYHEAVKNRPERDIELHLEHTTARCYEDGFRRSPRLASFCVIVAGSAVFA